MADFKPDIGWVICHAYLWWNEARRGREEGVKDRPCVIVHTRMNEYEETEVYISPITHTRPEVPERAIAIPPETKARLDLDREKSWIVTTEVNRFIWPGPDIRDAPDGGLTYGHLPADLTEDVVQQIKANASERSLLVVSRDDEALNDTIRRRRKPRET